MRLDSFFKLCITASLCACSTVICCGSNTPDDKLSANHAWSEDFNKSESDGLPANWQEEGSKFGVPETKCKVIKSSDGTTVLQIKCDKSTGGVIVAPKVNLNKTPIMRWRWRLLSYPNGADGRNPKKDDQPVGIYLGMEDGFLKKKSIAYRWEDLTPKGFEGTVTYARILTVHYITMRDNKTKAGEWVTETRNVAEDFKRVYGKVPKKFALSVIGNSQYTKSHTVAELDFIEFLPAK